jgi:hypothetical protein
MALPRLNQIFWLVTIDYSSQENVSKHKHFKFSGPQPDVFNFPRGLRGPNGHQVPAVVQLAVATSLD